MTILIRCIVLSRVQIRTFLHALLVSVIKDDFFKGYVLIIYSKLVAFLIPFLFTARTSGYTIGTVGLVLDKVTTMFVFREDFQAVGFCSWIPYQRPTRHPVIQWTVHAG